MSTPEPGLDLHEWQTQMAQLEEDLEASPEQALPDFADLVEAMLVERGMLTESGEPAPDETHEPDVLDRYTAAREVATRAEGGNADPGDVAAAIENLRELYDHLVAERGTP